MYGDTTFNASAKQRAFVLLKARNAVRAEVAFSGGNDEGGVDEITLIKRLEGGSDERIELQPFRGGYRYVNGQYVRDPVEADSDAELAELLERPVDDRYGSFAGDFDVYGTVIFDVEARTVKFSEEVDYHEYRHEESYL